MSHNISKLGQIGPDATGKIALSIDQLDGVDSASVGSNQTIVYSDAQGEFIGADAFSGIDGYNFALFGRGEEVDYATSGLSVVTGAVWGFYDSAPTNYLPDQVTFNYGAAGWLSSITFQPGTYEIMVQTYPLFSASGNFAFRLETTQGDPLSNFAIVGNAISVGDPSVILVTHTFSSETSVSVNIVGASGLSATQSTHPSSFGVILVRAI